MTALREDDIFKTFSMSLKVAHNNLKDSITNMLTISYQDVEV